MPLFTETQVRAAAQRTRDSLRKSYSVVLAEAAEGDDETFDIFLSHSIKDTELVVGARSLLRQFGYNVYVDWIEDRELDRTKVSRATALRLRKRMRQCHSLLYLSSTNSGDSKWMPWELGFFDGFSDGRIAVLPISTHEEKNYFGQEYLGIYPYVDVMTDNKQNKERLWVNHSANTYGLFEDWLKSGENAIRRRS